MNTKWYESKLKEAGKLKGQLADAMGISAPALSSMFSGRRMLKAGEAVRAAEFLGVNVDTIIENSEAALGNDL